MKAIIAACVALLPFAAHAEIDAIQKDRINLIAQTFSDTVEAAEGIEPSIAAFYPPFADVMAIQLGFTERDALYDQMRLGYAYCTTLIEIIGHEIHLGAAQYGETDGWTWGMIPYSAQSRQRIDLQMLPESCSGLLVFGQDDAWYQYTLNRQTNGAFIGVLPQFEFVNFFFPDCNGATS